MSLTASEMTPADIAAVNGNNDGGFGDGNGAWWLIVLFLFAFSGGWGNGFGGNGGAGAEVQRGFDQNATMNGIGNLQNGINGLSTQLCNGFANAETAATARQMANMNQSFAGQMAMAQGFNDLGAQFANCCCENRLGIANLGADIAREACADRATVSEGVRDIITNQTASTQAILDKLCQQELDAERRENQNLRTELNMANLAASQTAQTGRILADNAAQTVALEQYLNPVPVPAYVVQNPNCCPQNNCGCNL